MTSPLGAESESEMVHIDGFPYYRIGKRVKFFVNETHAGRIVSAPVMIVRDGHPNPAYLVELDEGFWDNRETLYTSIHVVGADILKPEDGGDE